MAIGQRALSGVSALPSTGEPGNSALTSTTHTLTCARIRRVAQVERQVTLLVKDMRFPWADTPMVAVRHAQEGCMSVVQKPASGTSAVDRWFMLTERGSTYGREVRGGLVIFFTMAYIVVLNPLIIGTAKDMNGEFVGGTTDVLKSITMVTAATALVAGLMTILMGAIGRFPIAIAAGLGPERSQAPRAGHRDAGPRSARSVQPLRQLPGDRRHRDRAGDLLPDAQRLLRHHGHRLRTCD